MPSVSSPKSVQPNSNEDIQMSVLSVVAEATGYPSEFLEMDADMEGELGIDSIKQAEIMAELRGMFSLPVDDSFQLREHPTLGHVINYIASFDSISSVESELELIDPDDSTDEEMISSSDDSMSEEQDYEEKIALLSFSIEDAVDDEVIQVVVEHTGYLLSSLRWMQIWRVNSALIQSSKPRLWRSPLKFGLTVDELFQLREHPTLGHVIQYIRSEIEGDNLEPQSWILHL